MTRDEIPPRPATPRGVEPVTRRGVYGEWTWKFRTRWKDPVTGRRRRAVFDTVEEVTTFRAHQRASRRGVIASPARRDQLLRDFIHDVYWPRYAMRQLAPNTRESHRSVLRRHVVPRLGHLRLGELSTPVVVTWRDLLLSAGVGAPTVRRAMVLLQGVCAFAIEVGELAANPVRDIGKPRITRKLAIAPPSPEAIEALRGELDQASATLVSLMAYEGLRPSEALAITERHIGASTLLVEQRLIDGQLLPGLKNGRNVVRSHRSPRLFAPVRDDLRNYLAGRDGQGGRNHLIFTVRGGQPWTTADYRRWREDTFKPAVERAGIELARPYDLRHACASLLLAGGTSVIDIAAHMGHSVAILSSTYAHVIADLQGQPTASLEQRIAIARSGTRA